MTLNLYYILFIFSVLIASLAQILLKLSANKIYDKAYKEYFNIYVILSYTILFTSIVLTTIAYRGVALKNGPIIESLGYVFVLLFSGVIIKERISTRRLIGILIIISGVIIFNL